MLANHKHGYRLVNANACDRLLVDSPATAPVSHDEYTPMSKVAKSEVIKDDAYIVVVIELDADVRLDQKMLVTVKPGEDEEEKVTILRATMLRRIMTDIRRFCAAHQAILTEDPGFTPPMIDITEGVPLEEFAIETGEDTRMRFVGTMTIEMSKKDWLNAGLPGQRRYVQEASRKVSDYAAAVTPFFYLPSVRMQMRFRQMSVDLKQVAIIDDIDHD